MPAQVVEATQAAIVGANDDDAFAYDVGGQGIAGFGQAVSTPHAEPVGEDDHVPLSAELRLRHKARLRKAHLERDTWRRAARRPTPSHRYLPRFVAHAMTPPAQSSP